MGMHVGMRMGMCMHMCAGMRMAQVDLAGTHGVVSFRMEQVSYVWTWMKARVHGHMGEGTCVWTYG